MIAEEVINQIDKVIKEIWVNEVAQDYEAGLLLREDSLKCALYHHMRSKLSSILAENNLCIYPEYYFKDLKYRADIAIVEIDPDKECVYLADREKNVVALFELKYSYGADEQTAISIKDDVWKLKNYIQSGKMLCQYYFGVIYESECTSLNWIDKRSSNNWAKGYVTELDAGIIDGQMWFEVNSYNGLNEELN